MIYLFENAVGLSLYKQENNELQIVDTHTFKDKDETYETYKLLEQDLLPSSLVSLIEKNLVDKHEILAVRENKLAQLIQEKCEVSTKFIQDNTFRKIRNEANGFYTKSDMAKTLNLSHKIAMEKVQLDINKLDTMIVQSINLLLDIDKDINLHCMRIREWYGFHFPELSEFINDNELYIKAVSVIKNKNTVDYELLKDLLGDKTSEVVKLIENSMGTEMAEEDIENIINDCKSIEKSFEYRITLFKYIKEKMHDIAPNLTILIGDLMGARLIAKAGSLSNLSKFPSSTIQLLGAEKSLFQALKNRVNTPKYGIIFESSLLGQVTPEAKGKLARTLGSKIALCAKVDHLKKNTTGAFGLKAKERIIRRIKDLENVNKQKKQAQTKGKFKLEVKGKYDDKKDVKRKKIEN